MVERLSDPVDRRAWRLVVTDKAQPIIERLGMLAEDMAGDIFAGLETADVEEVRAKLARVRENIGRTEASQRKSA
jgi:DNA-binding MarR family transcriptional regulator